MLLWSIKDYWHFRHSLSSFTKAIHFNENKHEFKDLEFVAIEKVDLVNGENANNPLLTREAYWMAQLCTISPYGLNKRSELRSKNKIHYKL